jgi:uncharacterized damage-inducible protein DinB
VTAFPEPRGGTSDAAALFSRYLEFYRETVVRKTLSLSDEAQRASVLPSGWTPIELLNHLRYVELRWLEWGFEGRDVGDPWGDRRDGRWQVGADTTLDELVAALDAQAARTAAIVESHDLDEVGQPSDRWDGADPASLERILFHILQEYARHVGHLDIVAEMAGGPTGE